MLCQRLALEPGNRRTLLCYTCMQNGQVLTLLVYAVAVSCAALTVCRELALLLCGHCSKHSCCL
jgi:hypothetical protein